jgi:predicted dehydrogenase
MPQQIRIGVIGTGGISRSQCKYLSQIDEVEVVAGADISEEALSSFAEQFECEHTFEDYHDLVQLDELDAVTVCTPNFLHAEPTIAALKAGKHVMVEKPMAMNADEARAMVDAAEAAGVTLTIGFQWRLGPQAQAIKQYSAEGHLGQVMYARVQTLRRRGIPSWGVFGRKDLQGGGPLIDIGVHLMETAHYLMGEPRPVSASANTWTYLGDREPTTPGKWGKWDHTTYTVEDLAVGMIRFDNGAMMAVESSFAAHIEKDCFDVTLMGDRGGARLMNGELFTDMAGRMVNISPQNLEDYHAMEAKIENWVGVLRGETENECPAESGLTVQKMLDALYRSAEEGKEVEID